MPIFESLVAETGVHGVRSRSRARAFVRAQLPLLVGAAVVAAFGFWALPDVASTRSALAGWGLIAGASLAFAALPWQQWRVEWLLVVAAIDVVGVALLRTAFLFELPSVGLLTVFPAVWLAYAFGRWAIGLAVASCLFVTLFPVATGVLVVDDRAGVAAVLLLPLLIAGLAAAVGEAARQLAASRRRTAEINAELTAELTRASDNERFARSIIETVDVALAFYDTEEQLVMANELAERAVAAAGFRLDEPPYAGPNVRRADNTTPIPYDEQIVPRALRGDLHNHEMEWLGLPGNQAAILATAKRIERSDGTTWGTLIAAYDVTQLARSLQLREQFISTVSHELRTPLTLVVGHLDILVEELADADPIVAKSLGAMRRGTDRLQRRVQEILDTAERRKQLQVEPTDIGELLRRSAEAFTRQAHDSGLTIETEVAGGTWATVDPRKLEQVVENLISNSLKYTPSPGRITLFAGRSSTPPDAGPADGHDVAGEELPAEADDDSVVFGVTDTGIGMSGDEVEQAFDAFYRADAARDQAVPGVGLGLGLVRDIVTAHRGRVDISSTPGAGTTITITVPRQY